ncbi:ATP-binding protein [Fodinibius halophilus]|uniref:ATP-binding protein n=1 Tax=Fodinibius halophilus TaxID=1736908 RepID=A0A6M1SZ74_9BACT|nr:ATP-binding protein [Fodinibius halophilus]NGP89188.1 hypothetical protein [Fodinibius halophilus]
MSEKLKIKFAGRFIDLLGQQMYGGPVPAVAELVANAWDADSKKVEIKVPENLTDDSVIVVKDNGRGMTFEELNKFYLNVGYERRKKRGEKTEGGRPVMGRKGIGKLAGFGIAEDIVLRSVKDGKLVEFTLNYAELRNKKELDGFEFIPNKIEKTSEKSGVTVIYQNLKLERSINRERFKKSMARRFALNTEQMQILVNGDALKKDDFEFEHRIPSKGWQKEEIEEFGEVEYWFGFTKNTIDEPELRGISVFARDRVAQFTPFFFNLSGGITGQVGLEYLTGQVKANQLDEKDDYIATDRQTVNWQFNKPQILEKWGKGKIKELCKNWKKRRDQAKRDRFKHEYSEFNERIQRLSTQEKEDITSALDKIALIERINEEDFKTIAGSMIQGVERESVRKVIKRINETEEGALPELIQAIKEWDIISAVSTAEVIFGKIEIIEQFKKHIDNRIPEKSPQGKLDMQDFIKDYPWLLGQKYEHLTPADFHHEKGVDKWIEEVLKDTNKEFSSGTKRENRRFDLLCMTNDWQIVILELMRPGLSIDYDHVMRLNRYVTRVKTAIETKGTASEFSGMNVKGILIADKRNNDPSLNETINNLNTTLKTVTWDSLFETVQGRYKTYLDILKMKAPEDPRIKGLVDLN